MGEETLGPRTVNAIDDIIREAMERKSRMEKENTPESDKLKVNYPAADTINPKEMDFQFSNALDKPAQQTITARIEGGQTSSNLEDHLERPVTLEDMRKAMSVQLPAGFEESARATAEAIARKRAEGEIERPRPVPNVFVQTRPFEAHNLISMETIREALGPNVQIIARSDLIKTGQDIIKNQPDDLNVFLNELADRIFGKELN